MEKTAEELYRERLNRIDDTISLKIPDRVPVEMVFDYFPMKYAGIPFETAFYDYDKWVDAFKKAVVYLQPDALFFLPGFVSGTALEILDPRPYRWPGHGVDANKAHQFIEGDWMKADEYEDFLTDHTDYLLRTYLPRVVGAMEPLSNLPRLSTLGYGHSGGMAFAEALANPEIEEAILKLIKAGKEIRKWRPLSLEFRKEIEKLGCPINMAGGGGPPFDAISDFLRGMHGAMLDMYRQPDKLHKTMDWLLARTLERISAMPEPKKGRNRVFMALHRGSDGFMSLEQFEEFYWPGLKTVILAFVDKGYTPGIFFEGDWSMRLEYLLELPKAKVLGHFDATDMFRLKEVLGEHMCIRGNVPSSLLQTGTTDDVKAYCKKLIDVVGKDGGLIVCPRSSTDEAKPENLKAMIDFTREYGVYK